MRVRIEDIRRGRPKHATDQSPLITYAKLVEAESGALIINATLDYILDKVQERGYEVTTLRLRAD